MAPKSCQIAHIYCLFFLMVVVCLANRDTDNTVKASKFNKDIYINLAKMKGVQRNEKMYFSMAGAGNRRRAV